MEEVQPLQRGSATAAIPTGAVQLVREYTGRGPTKASTTLSDNSVLILLGDLLTRASASWSRPARQTMCWRPATSSSG